MHLSERGMKLFLKQARGCLFYVYRNVDIWAGIIHVLRNSEIDIFSQGQEIKTFNTALVNAPPGVGALFRLKQGTIRSERPVFEQQCENAC